MGEHLQPELHPASVAGSFIAGVHLTPLLQEGREREPAVDANLLLILSLLSLSFLSLFSLFSLSFLFLCRSSSPAEGVGTEGGRSDALHSQ